MDTSVKPSGRLLALFLVVGSVALLLALVSVQGPATLAASLMAPLQTPTPGVNYEVGNFCVDDYQPGSNCTSNDVRIAGVVPTIEEACVLVGDTATVQFQFQFVAGSNERYDIALFLATDGGSAQTGDACYHDFLQPSSEAGPWDLTTGFGPFKELESSPDQCGDIEQGVPNFYYTQVPVTVQCVDNDGDGVVDPFSTCTSWDNNQQGVCSTVKDAYPSTNAKCRCETVTPDEPILIYRGYDWGDLPDDYGTLTASDGARHAIQDSDADNIPNTQGGVAAVWLGDTVDFSPDAEADGQPDPAAALDDANDTDDEDGVTPLYKWLPGTNGGKFSVDVNSSTGDCTGCKLGFWIDWNNDLDFDDADESYLVDVVFGNQTITFDIPLSLPSNAYVRFRLYAGNYVGDYLPTGLVVNGEVEDYWIDLAPLAVTLASFTAEADGNGVTLAWETVSEVHNVGFNVLRSTAVDGQRTQLAFVPAANPGSTSGASYSYRDNTVTAGQAYWYWLEDLDTSGATTLHGPVSAMVLQPSVRMRTWLPMITR